VHDRSRRDFHPVGDYSNNKGSESGMTTRWATQQQQQDASRRRAAPYFHPERFDARRPRPLQAFDDRDTTRNLVPGGHRLRRRASGATNRLSSRVDCRTDTGWIMTARINWTGHPSFVADKTAHALNNQIKWKRTIHHLNHTETRSKDCLPHCNRYSIRKYFSFFANELSRHSSFDFSS